MTRLTADDIADIRLQLVQYDRHLETVTGSNLLGIAAAAANLGKVDHFQRLAAQIHIAVVPIRSGLGTISGFAETVGAVCAHLGFSAEVTGHADVAGLAEAVDRGADVIMAADDERFVAFCPRQGKTVDNSRATARGFVSGLELMAGGLGGKSVLVLGCGPVGTFAVEALLARKAKVCVLDREPQKARDLARRVRHKFNATVRVAADPERALGAHPLIVEATDAAGVIRARHVGDATRVAAPGMPCGLSPRAREKLAGRFLHDPLQIGVATMACEALRIVGAHGRRGESS
jgi:pyrrolysine biosynthesis protein PylD